MTIKNFKFAFIFILLCSFVSCNNNKEEVISESASTDTDISSDEDILSEDQEQNSDYQFIPPSPIQIGLIFHQ